MNFLADESFDFRIVRALRAAGHDVSAVCELAPAARDQAVMRLAENDHRILLTEDKDFGWLVYVSAIAHRGVILVRCPESRRSAVTVRLLSAMATHMGELSDAFTVVTPDKTRVSRLPILPK